MGRRTCRLAIWPLIIVGMQSTAHGGDLDVVINELLYHPPEGLEEAEYIELYNRGDQAVDVSGWRFTDGITHTIAGGTVIPPQGFLLVVKDRTLASSLYAGVPLSGNFGGSLSNGGERLRLENAQGILVQEFAYSDGDGWPEEADGTGASLEKVLPELEPWFADSWGASVTLLGSPGKINTQFHQLVDLDLVLVGEDWRYFKGTEEPSAALGEWAGAAFDDSGWLVGPSGIGYGDGDDATVLADMQGNYTTVYLRRQFDIADPGKVEMLSLTIDYDDAFVLYLNGVEVARRNAGGVAGEPLPFDALALGNREAGVSEVIDLTPRRDLLAAGANVIAIQGLNQALTSTDFSLAPALAASVAVSGIESSLNRLSSKSLIAPGSSWSYFKGLEEPAPVAGNWTLPDFDASAWETGPAGFGYSDGDDATVLADMQGSYTTLYIRHVFQVEDAAGLVGLTLGVRFDDGFIAYLNGVEVVRSFAPGSPGEFQAFDSVAAGNHEATGEEVFDLTPFLGILEDGDNVFAVHGFNAGPTSSDFSLHPRLSGLVAVRGDPAAIRLGVSIHEVFAPGGQAGWIEVRNGCCDAVDLSGFGLSIDGADPLAYRLPEPTVLPAGAFLVVGESELGSSLPPSGTVLLTDPAGVVLVDGRSYEIRDPNLSTGSFPDGDAEFWTLGAPTRGAPNAAPPEQGVVIHEIMYHPLAAPGAEELEWIELHNTRDDPADLSGWAFTRGIDFELDPGTSIPPGGYLVVARDPAAVQAHYGIAGVAGGFTSGLKNDDELIVLRDHLGNAADRVHYADDGRWPPEPDGNGPSLELVHPDLENRVGHAWRASAGEGTPGAPNSAFSASPPPVIRRLRHFPLVPGDGESVTVSLDVSGIRPIATVRLFYRASPQAGEPAAPFTELALLDDGASGDGAAGDGTYGGTVPGHVLGTVVEFFVEAEDDLGNLGVVPAAAPDANCLYLVDDPPPDLGVPAYRVIVTPADRFELESRSVQSDVLLNATFLSGGDVFYRVGVRYRGKSSRNLTPKSYRVEFTDDEEFEGTKRLNLNANQAQHQHLGMALFRGAGVPASLTRLVQYVFDIDPARIYARMEAVDEDFLARVYPTPAGEDEGNLYRGIENGNLDYRGTDPDSYRGSYEKKTNEQEDDWSDLIALSDVLTNTPDADLPSVLPAVIDVEEWIRFFAAHTLISTQEGGIYRDRGDDYFLYRRPSSGLWVLIPWDLDDSFRRPTEELFRPTVFQIRRILRHPHFSPRYYDHLVKLGSTHFAQETLSDRMDLIANLFPAAALQSDLDFVANRLAFIDSSTNLEFTVALEPETLVPSGARWKFFRGTMEPAEGTLAWTESGFDDSSWEEGPTGIGYGDGDDATVLEDMMNGYTTVYLRHAFDVADPAAFEVLELAVDYDDGFIAFLNGVEIARANAGARGTFPSFDGLATASREAGSFQVFDAGVSALLVSGTNVLSAVVLNLTLDSSDLSFIPELRTGGVAGEACPGDFFVTGDQLIFAGLAPVTQARFVRVDGEDAEYDHLSGEWTFRTPLDAGSRQVRVEVLDRDLRVVASDVLSVRAVHTVGGVLGESTTWALEKSPFLVVGQVTVPSGVDLLIEAGVELFIETGVGFTIDGELKALGTEVAPIVFQRIPCHGNWGNIVFQSRAANELRFCELSRSDGAPGCITARSSNLDLESCHIHDIAGEGVSASGSTTNVRNTLVERTNESLSLDFGRTVVEFSTLRNAVGKSDLCDANGSNNPPARIAFNRMHGTSDDAIDADRGSVFAEGNIIFNCGDQGISLVGAGNSTVVRNVVYRNNHGLSVKDSHVCFAEFNTLAFNRSTGARAIQKTAGNGGGIITIKNSIIWGSSDPLFINSTGRIDVSYSDVEGTLVPGEGNINLDPRFVNAGANDFRLLATSPCIGAADDGDDMGALPFEITPRAPAELSITGVTGDAISLRWKDSSAAEDRFELERRVSAGFSPASIVSRGDEWQFFRGFEEPAGGTLDWTALGFDDSSWEEGPSGIGYGDGDDATVLTDMQGRYSTVYLRRVFEIANPAVLESLELVLDFDDGIVVYLNGIEVTRQFAGRPGTVLAHDSFSADQHEAGEPVTVEFSTEGILQEGPNVLAVQGLNATLDSSDLSLIVELRTADPAPFELLAVLEPNHVTFTDSGLSAGTLYSYRVRAGNIEGVSRYSNIVTRETADIPAAPANLRVAAVAATSITLAWDDTSSVEDGFELERAQGDADFELAAALPAGAEAHTDGGLDTGVVYKFRVRAVNAFGASAWSNTVTQVTGVPPEAPSDLVVVQVLADSIELSWSDNSENETGFQLQARFAGDLNFQDRAVLGPDATGFADAELPPGQSLTYRVRAFNEIGSSDFSNEVTAETGRLPEPPADLSVVSVRLDGLTLAWVGASGNEDGFEVERLGPKDTEFQPLAVLGAGATLFADEGLLSGTDYSYRVRAFNGFGVSAYSAVATATTGRLPAAPAGLHLVARGLDFLELSWLDAAENEDGYELERMDPEGAFARIAELPPGATAFRDAGLEEGTEYGYRVRAVNAFGPSPYSEVLLAATGRLPEAPGGLVVVFVGHDSITIAWEDRSLDETSFEIDRSDAGGPFAKVGDVAMDATAFSDGGLAQATDYAYRVRAVNEFGSSAPSGPLVVTTGRLPDPPSGLVVLDFGLDFVDLAWTDVSDNETSFEVERRTGKGTFVKVADVAAGSDSYRDASAKAGTEYEYRVRAVNEFGPSAYSDTAAVRTGTLPERPRDLVLIDVALDALVIGWTDASAGEERFEVDRRDGGPFETVATLPADTTSYADGGLIPGTDYVYRVRAVNRFGSSAPSAELVARTGSLPPAPEDLRAVAVSPHRIEIAWTYEGGEDAAFEVERQGPGDDEFARIAELEAGTRGHADENVAAGELYRYRVRSLGAFGRSGYAGPVEVKTPPDAPLIDSIEPPEGPAAGGTLVTIRGENFQPGTSVRIGGAELTGLLVVGPGEARGATPSGARGAADVEVETPAGTAVLAGGFLYFEAFLRGDTNGDGEWDVSDAIHILQYLFQGGAPPPCEDVADVNSDAGSDISDALFLLAFLFQGGAVPEPEVVRCE